MKGRRTFFLWSSFLYTFSFYKKKTCAKRKIEKRGVKDLRKYRKKKNLFSLVKLSFVKKG
jgi:hypothetical protein